MNGKMNALALHKKRLLAKISRQRLDIAHEARILKGPLAAMDRGISIARYLCKHPLIPALATATFFVIKPAHAFKWMKRGWFLWGLYKNARRRLSENG
ncbi:MAG: YqjK-like family protein [Burkholderiales bacterium]|nr:YqjK-like family protein [Burkholderiales bacterium]